MRSVLIGVLLLVPLLLVACGDSSPKDIDAYEGRWLSRPFGEMVSEAVDELIEDLRDGDVAFDSADWSEEDHEELLAMSDEELRSLMEDRFKSFDSIGAIQFAIEISSSQGLVVSMVVNGEEAGRHEESGQFEVTDREILFRGEEETRVIHFDGDGLKIRNEDYGKYPRFIKLYREVDSAGGS